MHFSTLSNIGETEILLFACDLSGRRLKFLYIHNIESLDLYHVLWHIALLSDGTVCWHDTKIIFLQLTLLGETSEEPNSEHLFEMVCPFILSFMHIHTIGQKVPFVPGGKACSGVTFLVFHSFVWACKWFLSWWMDSCVSGFFHCRCWLSCASRENLYDSCSSCWLIGFCMIKWFFLSPLPLLHGFPWTCNFVALHVAP